MSLTQLKLLKTVITAKAVSNATHLCAELAAQGMAEGKPACTSGAAIFMSLALNSARTLADVDNFHCRDADDLSFSRTKVARPSQAHFQSSECI